MLSFTQTHSNYHYQYTDISICHQQICPISAYRHHMVHPKYHIDLTHYIPCTPLYFQKVQAPIPKGCFTILPPATA